MDAEGKQEPQRGQVFPFWEVLAGRVVKSASSMPLRPDAYGPHLAVVEFEGGSTLEFRVEAGTPVQINGGPADIWSHTFIPASAPAPTDAKPDTRTDSEKWPDATPVPHIPGFWSCDGIRAMRIDLGSDKPYAGVVTVIRPDSVVNAFQHPRPAVCMELQHVVQNGFLIWTSHSDVDDIVGPVLIYFRPHPEYAPKEPPRIRVLSPAGAR